MLIAVQFGGGQTLGKSEQAVLVDAVTEDLSESMLLSSWSCLARKQAQ